MIDNILFNETKNKKNIIIWYGNKVRVVPLSVIYRRFNLLNFDLKNLINTKCIQIYIDNVIRLHLKHSHFEEPKSIFIEDVDEKCIAAFIEILNSDEDYFIFKNRFKVFEIDEDSGIYCIVSKSDMSDISFDELPIKVYGFIKATKLDKGNISFSYKNLCDLLSASELQDIKQYIKKELKSKKL